MSVYPPVSSSTTGYLNSASHGVPDASVYRRMIKHLQLESRVGPARAFSAVADEYYGVRAAAASLIDAQVQDDVSFGTSGTRAWNDVVTSMNLAGGRVLAAPHEWGANLRALSARDDLHIEVLPALSGQDDDLDEWASLLDDDVCALIVPMVSSLTGERYPVEKIGALSRPTGCAYVVDAAQALGQMPVSVLAIGCDALVAPTRKWLCGPRGTAIAWRRPDFNHRRGLAFEHASDLDVSSLLGLGTALRRASPEFITSTMTDILALAQRVRKLSLDRGLVCLSPFVPHSGITSLEVSSDARAAVEAHLRAAGSVLKWLDADVEPNAEIQRDNTSLLRLSTHYYTTDEDVVVALDAIAKGVESAQ